MHTTPQDSPYTSSLFFFICIVAAFFVTVGIIPLTLPALLDTKLLGLAVVLIGTLVVSFWRIYSYGYISLPKTKFLLPSVLLLISTATSAVMAQQYPVEQFWGAGGVIIVSSLVLALAGSLIKKDDASTLSWVLLALSCFGAVMSLTQFVGFGPSQVLNWILKSNFEPKTFHLFGSAITSIQVMAVALGVAYGLSVKLKKIVPFVAIASPILLVSFAYYLWVASPSQAGIVQSPSWITSWDIALSAARSPREAFFGYGPSSYENVYSQLRPVWTNAENSYQLIFAVASNTPLTLLPTIGFIGTTLWLWSQYEISTFALSKRLVHPHLAYPLLVVTLLFWITPPSIPIFFIQALLASALFASQEHRSLLLLPRWQSVVAEFQVHETNNLTKPAIALLVLFAGVIGLLVVGTSRVYAGQVATALSARAVSASEWERAYSLLVRAIQMNPYSDELRRRMAGFNLTLGISLAEKTDLSEQENQQVLSLLQSAWQEAQSATILDPGDFQNWETRAIVYKNLIAVEPKAADYAVESYVAAAQRNPQNPALRMELGSLFLQAKNYREAEAFFAQAAQLKPDLANAYYNLGFIKAQQGDFEAAKQQLQLVKSMLPADSPNFKKIDDELKELTQAAIDATASGQVNQQKAPQPPAAPPVKQNSEIIPPISETNQETLSQPNSNLATPLGEINAPTTTPEASGSSQPNN